MDMSTESAVCNIEDLILRNVDKGKSTVGVLLDLAKAFSSIDRSILLKKLEFYGVRGHALIFLESNFSDRLQYIIISDTSSKVLSVRYGKVLGPTLGPLMFLVCINDIVKSSRLLKFTLYAEYKSACLSSYDFNSLINIFNREIKLIDKWFTANKITLNATKSEFIIFHIKQRQFPTDINEVKINESFVERITTMKFLGVNLD